MYDDALPTSPSPSPSPLLSDDVKCEEKEEAARSPRKPRPPPVRVPSVSRRDVIILPNHDDDAVDADEIPSEWIDRLPPRPKRKRLLSARPWIGNDNIIEFVVYLFDRTATPPPGDDDQYGRRQSCGSASEGVANFLGPRHRARLTRRHTMPRHSLSPPTALSDDEADEVLLPLSVRKPMIQ